MKKEAIKSLAILFLSCSAVFLASQVEAFTSFSRFLLEENGVVVQQVNTGLYGKSHGVVAEGILLREAGGAQWGPLPHSLAVEGVTQVVLPYIQEALAQIEGEVTLSEEDFRLAVLEAEGIYLSLAQEIPSALWDLWFSVAPWKEKAACISSLFLGEYQDGWGLYYEGEAGFGVLPLLPSFVMPSLEPWEGMVPLHLEAGQDSCFRLYGEEEVLPLLYQASTLTLEDQREMLEVLGFQITGAGQYSTQQGIVLRGGQDSIRLGNDGWIEYQGEESPGYRFSYVGEEISFWEQVEGCRQFAYGLLEYGTTVPDLFYHSHHQEESQLHLYFSAGIGGIPLYQGDSEILAKFTIEGERIVWFSLSYRNYEETEERSLLLPWKQAQGIYPEKKVSLAYQDTGAEQMQATWVARDRDS